MTAPVPNSHVWKVDQNGWKRKSPTEVKPAGVESQSRIKHDYTTWILVLLTIYLASALSDHIMRSIIGLIQLHCAKARIRIHRPCEACTWTHIFALGDDLVPSSTWSLLEKPSLDLPPPTF
ncbi:hypothetical protein HG530_005622 [Fusarium avenaceum]|nr:hypothetical protein HG530_005622 [Fusarium avenaceum]